jgi:hypothetical protein
MGQNVTEKRPALSDKQLQSLPYLAAAGSMTDAATTLDVSRTTLYRWMDDPDFRMEYERLREEASAIATAELRGLMLKATTVLADSMDHSYPEIRLRAAQVALNAGRKVDGAAENRQLIDLLSRFVDAFGKKE